MTARKHSPRSGRAGQSFWIFGRHAVMAALANPKRRKHRLVMTENAARGFDSPPQDVRTETLRNPRDLEKRLPPGAVHQGLALEVAPLEPVALEDLVEGPAGASGLILALDQVTDPHNVGAVLRSAAAFGALAVITTGRHAPPESGTLAKAACGALDIVPYVAVVNLARALDQLSQAGFWRIGLEGESDLTLEEALSDQPTVLVLGAEGSGLRRLTREHCDALARLPISGAMESLNVSNAAAIALYEAARHRLGSGANSA